MKKTFRTVFALVACGAAMFAVFLYRTLQLGRGDAQPAFVENLNPGGEMVGPEGIQFDASGKLYAADAQGIVWNLGRGGTPQIYAELARVQGDAGTYAGALHAGGMAFDTQGNLYVACFGFAGGSILRVDAGTQKVRFFARDMGSANFVLIAKDSSHLWVSDYRSRGRLLRYSLAAPLPAQPDQVVEGLEYPNGLASGKDEKTLYTAETYSGNIAVINFEGSPPQLGRIINLKGPFSFGSLDGLAFDPRDRECRFLYVAENSRGMFSVVDLQAQPIRVVKQLRLDLMGGRPCPASMVIRDGYLYFTDLWSCNPVRILLGIPKWHNHAYRFRVMDLSSIY